uniref:Uncharacterized protein n=1 Tax=Scleropages formosus TaxID=113540 RepID=A0A8C9V1X7_SCLFO
MMALAAATLALAGASAAQGRRMPAAPFWLDQRTDSCPRRSEQDWSSLTSWIWFPERVQNEPSGNPE